MKISSKGRYAVRVMAYIATAKKDCVSLSEIAEKERISLKYLEQIASLLTKSKLLLSVKGSLGGYKLSKAVKDYSIAEILSVTGDLPTLAPCQKGGECPQKESCSTVGCWDNLTRIIFEYLEKISLLDIINKTY